MSITELLPLMQSLDPLFPVGGFTLSNGLETYVQKELVYDKQTLKEFLDSYLYTARYNDLAFCAKAAQGIDPAELDQIYTASRTPYEIRTGSIKMCSRAVKAMSVIRDFPRLRGYMTSVESGECAGHHAIAVGLLIQDAGIDIPTAVGMYAYSILSAMTNHAAKLVPLRQLDAQAALAQAAALIEENADAAVKADIEDLGVSGFGFDLRAMQHERLYSRLYIS